MISIVLMIAATLAFVCCNGMKNTSGRQTPETYDLTQESPSTDFKYSITSDGSGVIINEYIGISPVIVIPATIAQKPVVEVKGLVRCDQEFGQQYYDYSYRKYVFPKENLTVTHIVYPDCVEKISWPCYNCNALVYVKLPAGLVDTTEREIWETDGPYDIATHQRIAVNKFAGIFNCKNLKTIIIPEGITNISNLSGNPSLEKVSLPSTIRYIADRTFYECTNLSEIDIPESLYRICFNVYDTSTGGDTSVTDGFYTFRKTNLSLASQNKLKYLGYTGSFN